MKFPACESAKLRLPFNFLEANILIQTNSTADEEAGEPDRSFNNVIVPKSVERRFLTT